MKYDNLPKSKREKELDEFLNQLETQEEYNAKLKAKIDNFYKEYSNELEDYEFISDLKSYNKKVIKGGYVRYFNMNEELKWGGILIKKVKDDKKDMNLMILCNSSFIRFAVSFEKNYVFYKKHQTAADKTRKIFMSALDKFSEYE